MIAGRRLQSWLCAHRGDSRVVFGRFRQLLASLALMMRPQVIVSTDAGSRAARWWRTSRSLDGRFALSSHQV
jgi:hypothetical protein